MADTLVIIPTYNELANLESIIDRVLAASDRVDVLVVDDSSPDGTGELADRIAETSERVAVMHRGQKSGLGGAYRAGFAWGLAHDYASLVEIDADGSHRPEQLPDLLAAAERADVVLGSRWVAGGGAPGWALRRALLSRAGSFYARHALGLPVHDVTGGYRVFSAAALWAIDFASVEAQGYCFQIEMAWRAQLAGLRIAEVPITFTERTIGVSKMSTGIVVEAILRVTIWGIADLPKRLRRRAAARARLTAASLSDDANTTNGTPVYGGPLASHRVDGRH
jgi:dolichol-phosphate mannosyltransferase